MAESRRGTIRFRTTAGAVVTVGVALLVGGVALVLVLRGTLTDEARSATDLRAREIAGALEAGNRFEVTTVDEDEQFVQILGDENRVVAASAGASDLTPMASVAPGESAIVKPPGTDEDFVAVSAIARTPRGTFTVLVARGIGDVADATRVVSRLLLVGLPSLLVVVGFTTWKVAGRALAPVERIRAEVDEISVADLHRRVPRPSGRDEVAQLAETMNRMLERLETSHTKQRRFISDASHELRSPVASIRQHAEVASAHPERTTVDELAGTVLAENARVQRLVEDLLLLARSDEKTLDLAMRPVDVDDLVFDEARRLRAATTLRVDTTSVSAARTTGDADALRKVLRNVGDNARRHAGTRISFSLSQANGTVLLAVDDDGEGIPEGERERVLERFVRLDDARARDNGGSGLGLAIVADLVQAHGGQLAIGQSPAGGVRVEVHLPGLDV